MTRFEPAWLDQQYDNRARIAEHPAIFERWTRASALARERSSRRLDVAYGTGPGETLDVFPTTRANAPVLFFIHGGWWRSLDKRDLSFIAPVYTRAGALVVLPNYALCPGVGIDAIVMQLVQAVAWTYRNAVLYGGDPGRIVVAGHSAGGHLASMLLCCDWQAVASDLPAQLVQRALSVSGVYDLEPIRQTPFLQADLHLTAALARRLSPSGFAAPRGTLYAACGALESEEFLRQNRLIHQAWGASTVPICETVPGTNHLDVLHALVDPQARLHQLTLELLASP